VVKIWDFTPENTFQPLTIFWEIPRAGLGIASVHSCSKNRDTIIAASSMDGHVRLYSLNDRKQLADIPVGHTNNFEAKLSPTGEFLATSGQDGKVLLYHLASCLRGNTESPYMTLGLGTSVYGYIATALDWHPTGNEIAQGFGHVGDKEPMILTYDIRNKIRTRMMTGPSKSVRRVRYLPGHQKIIACAEDQRIHYYDLDRKKTGACGWFWGHTGAVCGVDASKDQLTVASVSTDGFLKIWQMQSRRCMITLKPGHHQLFDCAYSCAGDYLVVCDDGGWLHLLNLKHPKKTGQFNSPKKEKRKRKNKKRIRHSAGINKLKSIVMGKTNIVVDNH